MSLPNTLKSKPFSLSAAALLHHQNPYSLVHSKTPTTEPLLPHSKIHFPASPRLMEHGSHSDESKSTFALNDEDHTFANSIRFTLNQDPRVTFCGYSIPHPSDNRVNIRVQTTGDPAREVLKDSCQHLMLVCQHVRGTFDKAVSDFRSKKSRKDMDIE